MLDKISPELKPKEGSYYYKRHSEHQGYAEALAKSKEEAEAKKAEAERTAAEEKAAESEASGKIEEAKVTEGEAERAEAEEDARDLAQIQETGMTPAV